MSDEKKLNCYVTKNLGRYNLASNDNDWCVQVMMPDGKTISARWPEDDEPDTDGRPPSEVIELIVARLNSYWICTNRTETLARIDAARPMFDQMDDAWARRQIAQHERQIKELSQYLMEV
ncbi:hypothetical protein [Burkholderia latens]|uniref:hypothetical protein n=1 Tax=Burkholderia latens TaxID=488446 RepID=UPI001AE39AAB|nr:hypothetical protein [Burkholderia latens]QTO46366.1 hypothetical protein J8I85_18140 [Burkholderia latens]